MQPQRETREIDVSKFGATAQARDARAAVAIQRVMDSLAKANRAHRIQHAERCTAAIEASIWCAIQVASGRLKNEWRAWLALAKTCEVHVASIRSYVRVGQFIVEHELNPESVNFTAVQEMVSKGLERATVYKCVDVIRSNPIEKQPGKISMLAMADVTYRKSTAARRASRILREKKGIGKRQLEIEMLALMTLAKAALGREDLILTLTDLDYTPLAEVASKPRGRVPA